MPIYEYRCGACGRTIEQLRSLADADAAVECPGCGESMRRVFSAPAGIRIGTGKAPGTTCCGRTERCDSPPCSDGTCQRDS